MHIEEKPINLRFLVLWRNCPINSNGFTGVRNEARRLDKEHKKT